MYYSMTIINNKYILIEELGSGSFGTIFKGQNIRTKEYVAIKVESAECNIKLLKNESVVLNYLNGCEGIPKIKWFGKHDNNYYMVINMLGISLQNAVNKMGNFSLNMTLKIGIKIILLLKTIHEKGLIHRDIKPDNFLFGFSSFDEIYIIDFGLCKKYINNLNEHIEMKNIFNLIGSLNYASISSHKRIELSRKDDLESLCYLLLYLKDGYLKWNDEKEESKMSEKQPSKKKKKKNLLLKLSHKT
jgi:serine/threonine protein kinase